MNKVFSILTLASVFAITFTACNKEIDTSIQENQADFVKVSIVAGNPEVEALTRTEIDGTTPYWSKDDAIGVAYQNEKGYGSYEFSSGLTARAETATFSAEVSSSNLGKTAYAFYPYTSNNILDAGIAPIDIPETQYPSLTSFDSKADLMVGLESFELSTEVSEMAFRRLGAVVKVIIVDKTSGSVLTGQHPTNIKLTVAENIIGRAKVDLINKKLDGFSSGAKKYVQASYTADRYEINDANATYFVVYPQTLAENSGITIEGSTESYSFSKTISQHPSIELKGGYITTLKIKVDAATVDESGAALPFRETFAAITTGNSDNTSGSSAKTSTEELTQFQTVTNTYKAGGAVRLGKSGVLTTNRLNLSSDFTVVVSIKGWSTSENELKVAIDGDNDNAYTFVCTTAIGGDFKEFTKKFSAATTKSTVTFSTDANTRVFIDDIRIVAGDYVATPHIQVEAPSIIPAAGGTVDIPFSIENPVSGKTLSVSVKDGSGDMITNAVVDAENSVISLTVSKYEQTTENRIGFIVLTYEGADNNGCEVAIEQSKASASGIITDIITYSLVGVTGTSYTEWANKSHLSSAKYSGRTAGGNASIQMNATTNTGFYSTVSGGYLKSITVGDWKSQSNASGKLFVYASNTAYSSFTNADEVKVAELSSTALSYTFTTNYKYIKVTGSGKAIYLDDIAIEWGSQPLIERVATPVISVANNAITISCTTSGAKIYYTKNGTDPSASSTEYSGQISLNEGDSYTIKAIAIKDGFENSEIAEKAVAYVAPGNDTVISIDFSTTDQRPSNFPSSSSDKGTTLTQYTIDGYNFSFFAADGYYWINYVKEDGSVSNKYLLIGKKDSYILLPAISGKKLTKVKFHTSSTCSTSVVANIYSADGNTAVYSNSSAVGQNVEKVWELDDTEVNTSYQFRITNGYNIQLSSLELTYQ